MFLKTIVILSVIAVTCAQVIHDGECRTDVEVVQNFNLTAVNYSHVLDCQNTFLLSHSHHIYSIWASGTRCRGTKCTSKRAVNAAGPNTLPTRTGQLVWKIPQLKMEMRGPRWLEPASWLIPQPILWLDSWPSPSTRNALEPRPTTGFWPPITIIIRLSGIATVFAMERAPVKTGLGGNTSWKEKRHHSISTSLSDVAWILSRTPELNSEVQEAVDAIVDKYLEREQLRSTIQDAETWVGRL